MTDLHVEGTPEQTTPPLMGSCSVSGAQLARLTTAELDELREATVAGAKASDDQSVLERCTRLGRLVVAEYYRRAYEQAAIDAKAAVIVAEERWRACAVR